MRDDVSIVALGRRYMSLLVLVALSAVVLQFQSMQSHASDNVQVEPVCKLDLAFAKRVLDAYGAVRHDLPHKALENEFGARRIHEQPGGLRCKHRARGARIRIGERVVSVPDGPGGWLSSRFGWN